MDRNFAVGFLLPSIGVILVLPYLLSVYDMKIPHLLELSGSSKIEDATILALCAYTLALLLLILNRLIIRFFEGYIFTYYVPLFKTEKLDKYNYISELIREKHKDLENEQNDHKRAEINNILTKITRTKLERFPHAQEFILPTDLGNVIRAFESYSFVMYGVDAIAIWPRLMFVISDKARSLVDGAKCLVDLWVNLAFIFLIIFLVNMFFVVFFSYGSKIDTAIIFIVSIISFFVCYWCATVAAITWGMWVKASFDVFLPKLEEELGMSRAYGGERQTWENYSTAVLYNRPDFMPKRHAKGRKK